MLYNHAMVSQQVCGICKRPFEDGGGLPGISNHVVIEDPIPVMERERFRTALVCNECFENVATCKTCRFRGPLEYELKCHFVSVDVSAPCGRCSRWRQCAPVSFAWQVEIQEAMRGG